MSPASASAQTQFAASLLAPDRPCPPGLTAWNGSDPARRLAVYRNNVLSSLIDALADTFPVTQALVGVEFFRALAARFVRCHPPRSCVLAHYGAELAPFIDAFEPARSVPYLGDVARLEFARVQAYHAADAEIVSGDAVRRALAEIERLDELQARCHPSVSVLASAHAVVSIWAAHQGEGELGTVDSDAPEAALVVRLHEDVLVLRLPPGADTFITALQRGVPLGAAAAQAAQQAPAFDLPAALALLLSHGALNALEIPRRHA
jgi:hypothetical protein